MSALGRPAVDWRGQRVGRLTVIERVGTRHEKAEWRCICDCGSEVVVISSSLRAGSNNVGFGTRSCGCLKSDHNRGGKRADFVGDRYGRLIVVLDDQPRVRTGRHVLARCDCGNEVQVMIHSLRSGDTTSCGCYAKEQLALRSECASRAARDKRLANNVPTYVSVHKLFRKAKGNAKDQVCACGSPAKEWSYDHTDASEMLAETYRGSGVIAAFSLDFDRYTPKCISCHRKLDRDPKRKKAR
jgi:hypothetical protein